MKLYEEDYPLENTLGLAFNLPNDTGEIHELLLEKSGDVKTVYKLDGFGTIQKITFALTPKPTNIHKKQTGQKTCIRLLKHAIVLFVLRSIAPKKYDSPASSNGGHRKRNKQKR